MIEKFFTTEQVANILQVHPFTILKFIKQGRLPGIKLGRVYRIKESDVKEFLDQATSKVKQVVPKPEIQDEPHQTPYQINKDDDGTQEHYYII